MEGQYLSEEEIVKYCGHVDIDKNDLISSDTYNEEKIFEKIVQNYNQAEMKLMIKAAIQISIIGAGNKNYGSIRNDSGEIIKLQDLFEKLNIKYNNPTGALLQDDDITARRLTRIFRFHIQNFLIKKGRPSYLWLKYANKTNKDFMVICFPGAEHLIKTIEEANFLIKTYEVIDKLFPNARFIDRLNRVFIARGIFNAADMV